ncbi:MAG: hypothetical protein GY711_01440 [bacterium]|nr:hypothetical protein [bacterium]
MLLRSLQRTAFPTALALGCGCVASSTHTPGWEQYAALTTPEKLGGCAVADLDPRHAGEEIATVSAGGKVYVVRRDAELPLFHSEIVAELPGEMIQCATGDLDGRPGSELYTVGVAVGSEDDGGQGAAWRIRFVDGEWERTRLLGDEALLHAVAVGDVDPDHAGDELVVAGFSRTVHLLTPAGDSFEHASIASGLGGAAKGAAIAGRRLVVACDDGALVQVESVAGEWRQRELANYGVALARVAIGPEGAVLTSANDGLLRLFEGGETLFIECFAGRLRGAVFADVDPHHDGVEMATAGYDGRILVIAIDDLVPEGPRFRLTPVGEDRDRLHHLAAGTLPSLGPVLVACGYSGRVLVVEGRTD